MKTVFAMILTGVLITSAVLAIAGHLLPAIYLLLLNIFLWQTIEV